MKSDKEFTPLNISYPIQKYSNLLVVGGFAGVAVILIGIIVTFKIKSDLAFSPVFGTGLFGIVGSLLSVYAGVFIFRKIGMREKEMMRLHKDMLDHEITTINDLWDIISIDGNLITYSDNSSKIILQCEKGFTVSRPVGHEEIHREKVEQFIKYLLDKGYFIDYYNWRDRDANTEPLNDLENDLNSNPNSFLRTYGNSVIKFCRQLEYQCTDSEIDYYVIASRDPNLSAYLESSVEAATEFLQGSLYEDISICGIDGFIKFIELIHKIKGINVSEMLSGNIIKTDQKVVEIVKVIGATSEISEGDSRNAEEELIYQQFLEEYAETEQRIKKAAKQKRNLAHKSSQELRPAPVNSNNIVEDFIPIPIDDNMPIPVAVNDVEENTVATVDKIEDIVYANNELLDDDDELLDDDDDILDD